MADEQVKTPGELAAERVLEQYRQWAASIREAEEAVTGQIAHLRTMTVSPGLAIEREFAILSARSSELVAKSQVVSILALQGTLGRVEDRIGIASVMLDTELKAFSSEVKKAGADSTKGAKDLARWTRALVWATVGLALAALIAAGVQAYAMYTAPPQIVIVNRS